MEIKQGDKVHFHFAGGPTNMPEPWTVLKVQHKFSTVNYKKNLSLTIQAANGVIETFDHAYMYSPKVLGQ